MVTGQNPPKFAKIANFGEIWAHKWAQISWGKPFWLFSDFFRFFKKSEKISEFSGENSGHFRQKMARIAGPSWPLGPAIRAIFWPNLAKFGQIWPKFDQIWPN